MQYIEDVYDMGEDAFDTSMSPEFLGGVGGIIAGATLCRLVALSGKLFRQAEYS